MATVDASLQHTEAKMLLTVGTREVSKQSC